MSYTESYDTEFDLGEELVKDESADSIREWVHLAPGEFTVSDVDRDFCFKTPKQRRERTIALERLVSEGAIQRVGARRGVYRPKRLECAPMKLSEVEPIPQDILLPLDIHRLCYLYPGNIMTIGGGKNAGKTAFCMNIAADNRKHMEVHYFTSEESAREKRMRCEKMLPLREWDCVSFYERSQNFADVVVPGETRLNIIDFLECHDEFYKMGHYIREIHDALNGAIAIIAIQTNPGNDDPIGGRRSTEKSRIHVSLHPGKLKIVVGKNWVKEDVNPNGMEADFKLVQGHKFLPYVNGQKAGKDFWKKAVSK